MLANGEIIERNIYDFQRVQAHMVFAKKENALRHMKVKK